MSVLHLHIPAFPIEIERLADRRLKGRPVAIAASRSGRAPLLYVSSEAHRAGVQKGMPRRRAERRERSLICLVPDERRYQKAQAKLLQLVSRFTPVYEPMRLGSVFLDMNGMELLLGKPAEAASLLRSELMQTFDLDPALGVARNKLVSRVATKVMRPHGLYQVYEGHEAEFLHPLPVEYLPGIGRMASGKLLRELAIRTIGDLAAIPVPLLIQLFGRPGGEFHDKALGEDAGTVEDFSRDVPRQIQRHAVLSVPSNDDGRLLAELWRLCEHAGAALRRAAETASHGRLEGVYVDGLRIRRQADYDPPTQSDFALFRPWELGWKKIMARRLRLKSLTLTLEGLQPAFEQLDFTGDPRKKKILTALDQLRSRYGETSVRFGR